jgi:hypothetical protein
MKTSIRVIAAQFLRDYVHASEELRALILRSVGQGMGLSGIAPGALSSAEPY